MSGVQGLPGNIARAASNFVSGDYKAVSTSPKESSSKAQVSSMGYFPNPVRPAGGFERANDKCMNALQLGGLLTIGLPFLAGYAAGAALINGYQAAKPAINENLSNKRSSLEKQVESNKTEIEKLKQQIPKLTQEAAADKTASELRKDNGNSAGSVSNLNLYISTKSTQLNAVNRHIEIIENANNKLQKQIDSIDKRLKTKEQPSENSIVYAEGFSNSQIYRPDQTERQADLKNSQIIPEETKTRPKAELQTEFTILGYQLRDVERRLRNDPNNSQLIAEHAIIRSNYDELRTQRNQNLAPLGDSRQAQSNDNDAETQNPKLSFREFTQLGLQLRDIEGKLRNDPNNPQLLKEYDEVKSNYNNARERNRNFSQ